jgi:predicted amidohydrolase YtcJ
MKPLRRSVGIPLLILFGCIVSSGCATILKESSMHDRTAFTSATLLTASDAELIRNGTIIMSNGRVEWVGPTSEAPLEGAVVIDVGGAMILPGLVDAHAHLPGLGEALETVSLVSSRSYEEVIERIARQAAALPAGHWVLGRGWDQNNWPGQEFPTKEALDRAIPDHPVAVRRIDGHALLVNSAAMELAGIERSTPDPEGGEIIRDANGEPTGVLIDNAMNLVTRQLATVDREDRKRRLALATETAARYGLTEVHDAGVSDLDIDLFLELQNERRLPIRVYAMLTDDTSLLERWYQRGPLLDQERVTVRAIKLYADGALGSRGAALHQPYSDAPDQTGLLVTPPAHIENVARGARAHGFQVGTHAIGDRGTTVVIEAYEKAGVEARDRYRIEHLQTVRLSELPRIAEMGVIASMQPTHATSDMPWAEARLGERIEGAYVWRSVLDQGIPLAFGSDFPVEVVNPFAGLYAAVTRQDLDGHPPGGWYPNEAVSIREAIHGFTGGAAFAAFAEGERGRLEPGMQADLVVIDRNLLEIDPREIPDTRVLYTVSGGRIVYSGARD